MRYALLALSALCLLLSLPGCKDQSPAAPMFYENFIQPILTNSCVRNQGGCHENDGKGNALGNLDLTSYANIIRRRDVLRTFGSYPVPLLLLKAAGPQVPPIAYQGAGDRTMTQSIPSEIQHAGGNTISIDSVAYLELQRWMDGGANEDGSVTDRPSQKGGGACRSDFMVVRPDIAAQTASVDTTTQSFKDFANNVEPVITKNCAIGTCHSSQQSDFFLTCKGTGSDDATKFNYLEAQQYVSSKPDGSPIELKPLAPSQGGSIHTGGSFFLNKQDPDWVNLDAWVTEVGPVAAPTTLGDGETFFRDNVMPVLLRRGCALEACHSPGSANDFKLRAGSAGGFFSEHELSYNYHEARDNFLVADIPDPRQTRVLKKPVVTIADGGVGLIHRGGPPLESAGDPMGLDPTMCPQPWSTASTAFCTLVEWHRIERADMLAAGTADPFTVGERLPLAAVVRPPNDDRLIDFDTFRPGADLVLGSVALDVLGAIVEGGATADGSLLDNCAGVMADRSNVDVRDPNVSMDASKVAFAMRLGAADSLDVYEVTMDATHVCTKITDGMGQMANGMLVHNFDPTYAFDGSLVFASTRGKAGSGPTRSLKYLLPQSDLWRMSTDGMGGYMAPEQMTALLGSEMNPEMMLNGEISFTAEKASPDFYQLSGRRINWDLTDYHPLLGQRSHSAGLGDPLTTVNDNAMAMTPSVGYQQATEIREGIDRNFVVIFSDTGTKGAGGTLATFNRSIGPFEADRNDIDFLKSVGFLDPAATGRAGATQGAYRSPFSLPDGRYLVSYDPTITDLSAQTPRYDLMVFDPKSGMRTAVSGFSGGASSTVEAVLIYKRQARPLFHNLTQLVFGGQVDSTDTTHGVLHFPDLPMLATLLNANLRTGRFVDLLRPATQVVVYQDQPPPSDMSQAMAGLTGSEMVYENRKQLGSAPLAMDSSVILRVPALTPMIVELQDAGGNKLFTMAEEDQLGPGEHISRGVPQAFFNSTCAGCHGSVSGIELDIAINQDALTQASVSLSRDATPAAVGP